MLLIVVSTCKKIMGNLLSNKEEMARLIIFMEKIRIDLQQKLLFTKND